MTTHQVKHLYKELLHLGRSYPRDFTTYFRPRLHAAFKARAHLADEAAIHSAIRRAEWVKKELEALYYLKKYRAMRKRYGPIPSAEVEVEVEAVAGRQP